MGINTLAQTIPFINKPIHDEWCIRRAKEGKKKLAILRRPKTKLI